MRFRLFSCLLAFLLGIACAAHAQPGSLAEIRALTEESKFDLALARLEDLLSREPDNVEARLYRGVILTRRGRVDDAIDAFRELAEEYPALAEPHNNLAVLYASRSRYDEARASLERAIAIQPDYDTAQENLGDIYSKLASLAYERAHALNPENEGAREKSEIIARAFAGQVVTPEAPPPEEAPTAAATAETVEPASEDTAAAASPTSSPPQDPGPTGACHRVDGVARAETAARIAAWAKARGASASVSSRPQEVVVNHKVFLPPLDDAAAADAEIERMKAEGIRDIIRIGRGDLVNGISLGVYGTEEALERRVRTLRERGYPVRTEPRYETRERYSVLIAGSGQDDGLTDAFDERFPDLRIELAGCT